MQSESAIANCGRLLLQVRHVLQSVPVITK